MRHSSYFRKPKSFLHGDAEPRHCGSGAGRGGPARSLVPRVPPPSNSEYRGPASAQSRPTPGSSAHPSVPTRTITVCSHSGILTASPNRGGGGGRRKQPLSLSNEAAGFGKLPSPFYEEPLYRISQQERNKEISVQLNWRLKLAILKNKSPINTTRIYG